MAPTGLTAGGSPLLVREVELDAIANALAAASAARGSVTLVEGAAGTGKSRLLEEATARAEDAGMEVLRATGDQPEREFAFGVVRQLVEARLWRSEVEGRERLLSGAAERARDLFEPGPQTAATGDADAVLRLVHGLFWVVQNLAERRSVALIVDDVHWADGPSLRFLHYLASRVSDLPVAVVGASRVAAKLPDAALLTDLVASPSTRTVQLAPLSQQAAATLLRARLPDAGDAFCAACTEATGGNPFYLEEFPPRTRASRRSRGWFPIRCRGRSCSDSRGCRPRRPPWPWLWRSSARRLRRTPWPWRTSLQIMRSA